MIEIFKVAQACQNVCKQSLDIISKGQVRADVSHCCRAACSR